MSRASGGRSGAPGRTFVIDALPEHASRYRDEHVIVAVDVFRATTVIVTALHAGHRVYPVSTEAEAHALAAQIPHAVLVGEQGGIKPAGFAFNNSPAAVAAIRDYRPIILLTSAGTQLLSCAQGAPAVYVASLRNLAATSAQLARSATRVALIGAGTRGEARAEDTMACARIGRLLAASGFAPQNPGTADEVARWANVDIESVRVGPSADYLRSTGQDADIDFVVEHVDDLDLIVTYASGEASIMATASIVPEAIAS